MINADEFVEEGLDGAEEGDAALEDAGHVSAERRSKKNERGEEDRDLQEVGCVHEVNMTQRLVER